MVVEDAMAMMMAKEEAQWKLQEEVEDEGGWRPSFFRSSEKIFFLLFLLFFSHPTLSHQNTQDWSI